MQERRFTSAHNLGLQNLNQTPGNAVTSIVFINAYCTYLGVTIGLIFIGSESAIQIPQEMIHYGMTKTALLAVSRGLAESCQSLNVTVNTVMPGPTLTEGVTDFVSSMGQGKSVSEFEEEYFRTLRPTSIIKRFQTPEEIADIVTFLCSERASSITGAAIRADGGVVKSCF